MGIASLHPSYKLRLMGIAMLHPSYGLRIAMGSNRRVGRTSSSALSTMRISSVPLLAVRSSTAKMADTASSPPPRPLLFLGPLPPRNHAGPPPLARVAPRPQHEITDERAPALLL